MSDIDFQNATVLFEGEWLSSDDLTTKIQEKMQAGDMKFSKYAEALEKLNVALENACKIDVQVHLLKEDYDRLKTLGGEDDDTACVSKAVKAFIEGVDQADTPGTPDPKSHDKTPRMIQCEKCDTSIELPADKNQPNVECPTCGTTILLKPKNKGEVRHKDHFIG